MEPWAIVLITVSATVLALFAETERNFHGKNEKIV